MTMRLWCDLSRAWVGILAAAVCAVAALPTTGAGSKTGVVVPRWPPLWERPAIRTTTIDFAQAANADAWLRHPILGDPSFDSFRRAPGNPLVKGTAPFRWPVNVSLLIDPVSARWYAYVGFYHEGYALASEGEPTHCKVFRSVDRGQNWEPVGPVFDDPGFRFEGDAHPASIAPDVCVVFHDRRYHMCYDWCTSNTTWANASAPSGGADSGMAYAWAEKPEGPFHRSPRPILRTSEWQRLAGPGSRYRRVYASSLVRRAHDWLVISDLDSGPHYAWGEIALTASDPLGTWSKPAIIADLEGDRYYPSPIEAFPAFAHDGYVYDPRTSVGLNRNFQAIFRAPIQRALEHEAWELWQHGSVWHAEPVPHEARGIWGQTLAARIDTDGTMRVLFPSRHLEGGVGTIGSASRPWSQPLRKSGFTITAHGGRTLSLMRVAYETFDLEGEVVLRSGTARLAWACRMPLGAEGRADGRPHPLCWTRHRALELTRDRWRVVEADETPRVAVVAQGLLAPADRRAVRIETLAGQTAVAISGEPVWSGAMVVEAGSLGLLLEPGTHLSVDKLVVTGAPQPAVHTWMFSEAISGAGVSEGAYETTGGPQWRFGTGALCKSPRERVKWNFRGSGFRLWLPRGPEFGRVGVKLDGVPLGEIDLAGPAAASVVVIERERIDDGFHALVLTGLSGAMLPVDSLEALQ